MSKVIAVLQEKGGVAKTTTVKNLAAGLSQRGYKVLAIDLDASANLSKSIGFRDMDDEEHNTICDVLDCFMDGKDFPEDGVAIYHNENENFDFVPGSYDLHGYDALLMSTIQKEIIIRNYILSLKDRNYDYVLLDCQAGLGILTVNALFAADYLIIPVSAEYLAIDAMQNLFKMVYQVRRLTGMGTKPDILGVLFTQVRANTVNNRELMEKARQQYGDNVNLFQTTIPLTTMIPESDVAGASVLAYAPNSMAAMQYNLFIDECMNAMSAREEEE